MYLHSLGVFDLMMESHTGGAEFAASFGPGRYKAYVCVDFSGAGFTLGKPTEYGAWLANFSVRWTTNLEQLYYGTGLCLYAHAWLCSRLT